MTTDARETQVASQAPEHGDSLATPTNADGLPIDSYTALQLQHGTAEHLHITSRRCFIGPIPEAWLSRHRKSWYRYRPSFARYSSRTASFLASNVSNTKSLTGLEGMTGRFTQSFPQPTDVGDDLGPVESLVEPVPDNALQPVDLDQANIAAEGLVADGDSAAPEDPLPGDPLAERPGSPKSRKGKHKKDGSGSSSWWKRPSSSSKRPAVSRKSSAKSTGSSSFVTAAESINTELADSGFQALDSSGNEIGPDPAKTQDAQPSRQSSYLRSPQVSHNAESVSSTAGLLDHQEAPEAPGEGRKPELDLGTPSAAVGIHSSGALPTPKSVLKRPHTGAESQRARASAEQERDIHDESLKPLAPVATNLVRFNEPKRKGVTIDDQFVHQGNRQKRSVKTHVRRRSIAKAGQLVKAERMLVRVDSTAHELGNDFDENEYFAKEAKAVDKWREFVVVCRQSPQEGAEFVLRMYKSRVVPFVEDKKDSKKYLHEIYLRRKEVHVNLFSSLDKTVVIWAPWKKFTRMYILKPQSSSDAVQWYHFLRVCMGWHRPPVLRVRVPDLDVTLTLDNPFLPSSEEKQSKASNRAAEFSTELQDEGGVARGIVLQCLRLLSKSPLGHTTEIWKEHGDRLGLAWRRYDRLEWISGISEKNMYGSMAMQVSHELELRPKQHYPTQSTNPGTLQPAIEEPPAVEGFLVRMTSQKGRHSRAGRNFYKKLYFYTHDHLLCFCQPSKAIPPKPSKIPEDNNHNAPKAKDIAEQIPLIYGVNPFPLKRGRIEWLCSGKSAEDKVEMDRRAYEEAERRTNMLLETEAYVDLTHIVQVRRVLPSEIAPPGQGSDSLGADLLTGDEEVDSGEDEEGANDAQTPASSRKQSEAIERSFEVVLKNGLTMRLQAYSKVARKEWVKRLRGLVTYWKARSAEDSSLLKSVRRENLDCLQIDEEMEAVVGQFARKWEVRRSVASAQLWNMCGIASCRSMTMYGVLYRKPRTRGTFSRCNVVLVHGHMLIFQGALRKASGKAMPHIHHERQEVIDLDDAYVYSGLVTDSDLLYQNQTFSPEHPGHSATPRIYLEDTWTSSDEDTMTCFCIWRGARKSLFRGLAASDDGNLRKRLRYVSSLGVPGKTTVFKTRSRAERDRWVLNIGLEIERLKTGEAATKSDIRITGVD